MSKQETEDIPNQEDFTDLSPNPAVDINLAVLCDALQRTRGRDGGQDARPRAHPTLG